MFKKIYTGLMLVAGVTVISIVVSRIFEKEECEEDCEECDNECAKCEGRNPTIIKNGIK